MIEMDWLQICTYMLGIAASSVFFTWRYFISKHKNNTGDTEFSQTQGIIRSIRGTVQDQVLNHNVKLFSGIARQKTVLNDQGRTCIAIFVSPDMFKELLYNADVNEVETLYEIMKDLRTPVGFLGDLPIYISEFLTEAPVFVVGGIRWSL